MRKPALTLLLILSLYRSSYSQSDSAHLTTITSKLEKLSATHPTEKVYLQFNKPGYSIGDTIWFKAYLTVGVRHQPSALSGVLYVDLIDDKDKVVKSLLLKNNNGITAGDFALDNKLTPGYYHIRAYTAWMRNFDPAYFFNQTIPVTNISTEALAINAAYSVSAINNKEVVNTQLVYADDSGKPLARRSVSYEVRADTGLLYSGQGATNDNGMLTFTFPGQTAPGQQIRVMSHLKLTTDITLDKTTPLNIVNENIDVQFFPEGGELVNNVRSKIAFKAIGTNGLGVNVKGTIIDNENNEIAEFQSQYAGMGVFALTPLPGKTYTARVTIAGNLAVTAKLPAANEKGFVLAINTNPADSTKLNVRVSTNEATLQERKDQSFYLVGQSGGESYYTTDGKLDNTSFTAAIPKSKFPSGITQFTLFSNTNEPLNERVVFIKNDNDLLNLELKAGKTTYNPLEKVNMTFNAKNNSNKPVQGSFSLTVYNEDNAPANWNDESSILSNLLLTSDLKGYIEEPNYYFNQTSDQTKSDLDVLMLTQDYRRFEWKAAMTGDYPKITYRPEKGLSISGKLLYAKDKPVIKGKVGLLSTANNIAVDTITNDNGEFTLTGIDGLPDTSTLVIQARMANNKRDVNIKLDSKTYPPMFKNTDALTSTGTITQLLDGSNAIIKTNTIAPPAADTTQLAIAIKKSRLFKNAGEKQLKEVTINARKNAGTELAPWVIVNPRSSNLNGPGHANMVFGPTDLESCTDIYECILNRLPGLLRKMVQDPKGVTIDGVYYAYGDIIPILVRHAAQSMMSSTPVKFMLDGVFVNHSNIENVNANDIQSVEVLSSTSYLSVYGSSAPGGLIIITTKLVSGDPNENYASNVAPGVITTKFKGFSKVEEFYVPKYTAKNTNTADTRDAIYWNPNITTDVTGKLQLEYFNSDVKGTYRAVIEGIDNDGNIGRFVYRYKVE